MDFDKAVVIGLLGLFSLVSAVIGIILTVILVASGHLLPEGLVVLVVTCGLVAFYIYSREAR